MKTKIILLTAALMFLAFSQNSSNTIQQPQLTTDKAGAILRTDATTPCPRKTYPEHYEGSGLCTGNLPMTIDFPTLGFGLVYNSIAAFDNKSFNGSFGPSWDLSFDHYIAPSGANLIVYQAGQYKETYIPDTDEANTWRNQDRNTRGKIVKVGSEFKHHFGEGNVNNYKLDSQPSGKYRLYSSENYGVVRMLFFRDPQGRITSIISDYGVEVTFNYNGNLISSISNPWGGSYSFTYESGNLSKVTWPDGRYYSLGYAGRLVTSYRPPEGYSYTINYYRSGQVATLIPSSGAQTDFSYGSTFAASVTGENPVYEETFQNGMLVKVRDQRLETVIERYNTSDAQNKRVYRMISPMNLEATFTYYTDAAKAGLQKRVTVKRIGAPSSQIWQTEYNYNTNGYLTGIVRLVPNSSVVKLTTFTRVADRLTKVTPSTGAATTFNRDASGKVTKIFTGLGSTVLSDSLYDSEGRIVEANNYLSNEKSTWSYPDQSTVIYTSASGEKHTFKRDNKGVFIKDQLSILGIEEGRRNPNSMGFFSQEYTKASNGTELTTTTTVTHKSPTSYNVKTQHAVSGNTATAMMSIGETARASGGFDVQQNFEDLYLASPAEGEPGNGGTGGCEQECGPNGCQSGECDGSGNCEDPDREDDPTDGDPKDSDGDGIPDSEEDGSNCTCGDGSKPNCSTGTGSKEGTTSETAIF